MPHLLENEIKMVIDNAQAQLKTCLAAFEDTSNSALISVLPAIAFPANIDASGSNPAGTETSIRDGVQYIRYLVPDFLARTLNFLNTIANVNSLNGLANTLKSTLDVMFNTISDARFGIAKNLNTFNKTFDFAYMRIAQMGSKFKAMNDYVLSKMENPTEDMRTFIMNLVKSAAPVVAAAGEINQSAEVYRSAVPVFQESIKGAADCYGKMGSYISNAISTALLKITRLFYMDYVTRSQFETTVVMFRSFF